MPPLETPSSPHSTISQLGVDLESLRKPRGPPPADAFRFTTPTQESSTKSLTVDNETEYEWTREEDTENSFATEGTPPQQSAASSIVDDETEDGWASDLTLFKKVKKYKRRNQELNADFKEQQRVLMDLQEDYAIIKLKLAQVQTDLDSQESMAQEVIALRDLKLLELVKENDELIKQVRKDAIVIKQKDRTIAQLEDSLHSKNALYFETVQERDKIKEAFLALLQSDDAATRDQSHWVRKAAAAKKLKKGKWGSIQKNSSPSTASGDGRWLRGNF